MLFSFFFIFSPLLVLPVFHEQPPALHSAGTSLESYLYEQSRILERYPEVSIECYEEPCIRPEEFAEEQERIDAIYSEIVDRFGEDFESEEFYRLMMASENPADCSEYYDEYEMFVSCTVEEYRKRKTLPVVWEGKYRD